MEIAVTARVAASFLHCCLAEHRPDIDDGADLRCGRADIPRENCWDERLRGEELKY
jgi:hypothetical protein